MNTPTPLIKITDRIYAKLETYQPTGSVKDRMIQYIVEDAVNKGQIIPGETQIFEATSGNTGIALAAAAARLGCRCLIMMPRNMSLERRAMMQAFGAEIIFVEDNDFKEAIIIRDELIEKFNGWSPYQFENPLNIECHYLKTAPEIHKQVKELGLDWDCFLHGSGTGGTMMGMKKYIDENIPEIKCVLTQPAEDNASHGIQGINDGANFLLNPDLMDEFIFVKTDDAIDRMKRFAKEKGLLVGISSGANILAAEKYVEMHEPEGVVVTILCDRGERYLK